MSTSPVVLKYRFWTRLDMQIKYQFSIWLRNHIDSQLEDPLVDRLDTQFAARLRNEFTATKV